jgi:tRNA A37 threonylcarbamoyltransferase TsaD
VQSTTGKKSLDFSFSGLKGQIYHWLIQNPRETLSDQDIADVAYAVQEAITIMLAKQLIKAAMLHQVATIAIV